MWERAFRAENGSSLEQLLMCKKDNGLKAFFNSHSPQEEPEDFFFYFDAHTLWKGSIHLYFSKDEWKKVVISQHLNISSSKYTLNKPNTIYYTW